jgi:hypothetical protein
MACGIQQVCANGMCASQCAMGQTACPGDGGAPFCANTATDNANCGACGKTCGLLEVCIAGKCSSDCLMSQTLCIPDGGVDPEAGAFAFCTDTKTDNSNCGACFNPCPSNKPLCSMGTCVNPG